MSFRNALCSGRIVGLPTFAALRHDARMSRLLRRDEWQIILGDRREPLVIRIGIPVLTWLMPYSLFSYAAA